LQASSPRQGNAPSNRLVQAYKIIIDSGIFKPASEKVAGFFVVFTYLMHLSGIDIQPDFRLGKVHYLTLVPY
jgi:hypothetical protein